MAKTVRGIFGHQNLGSKTLLQKKEILGHPRSKKENVVNYKIVATRNIHGLNK